ncbi:PDR/VanB family oxidoreductase [Alkalihalobacillus sp. R86527]|uniref:PDR/VanB family oxidoreductase n=1 Tax=Alkalihalobacillus sp. R86527 TaxID=3093863 RepID=UPI00366ADC40
MTDRYRLTITHIEQVTADSKKFTLTSLNGNLPPFGAGAHLTLHLPMGDRQYSLITNPLDLGREYTIAVKNLKNHHGGSTYLHGLQIGDAVVASGPDNYFPIRLEAQHHVFFAGGIGITPFLSMMSYLSTLGKTFELHYAASNVETCPFYEEVMNKYSDITTFYFESRNEKRRKLKDALRNRTVGTHVYMCGPQPFMEMLVDTTKELHYPHRVVHEERFRPAGKIEDPKPFRVMVNGSDQFIVKENESLLQRLRNEGYSISYACRMGICGSCEVTLCEGEVLHSDSFLTKEEKKSKMLSCVSRGLGNIEISVDE